MRQKVFYPGATIGFIGNGPNMVNFVMAAIDAGFKTGVLTTDLRLPLKSITSFYYAEKEIRSETWQKFARKSDFVIYVSDLLTSDVINQMMKFTDVPQGSGVLEIREDRLIERTFLEQININLLPYETVVDLKDVYDAVNSLGFPIVIKPIQRGLKKDRQLIIRSEADIAKAALLLESGPYILETYLEDKMDLEMIVTSGLHRNINVSPAIQCEYQKRILQSAIVPAQIDPQIETELEKTSREIAKEIDFEGLMRINFVISQQNIYVKSITPFLNLAGVVFEYSGFNQYREVIKASSGVTTSSVTAINPCVLHTFSYEQISKIKLQWALKDKWRFRFYQKMEAPIAGYITIPTESIDKTLEQIEDTSIWN